MRLAQVMVGWNGIATSVVVENGRTMETLDNHSTLLSEVLTWSRASVRVSPCLTPFCFRVRCWTSCISPSQSWAGGLDCPGLVWAREVVGAGYDIAGCEISSNTSVRSAII